MSPTSDNLSSCQLFWSPNPPWLLDLRDLVQETPRTPRRMLRLEQLRPQSVGSQAQFQAVCAPSAGRLGRLRASRTARMTRQDGLYSDFSTRPLPCDRFQPRKPDGEGRRMALMKRPSARHAATPRNRTTRAPKLTVASVHVNKPWSILTRPSTMPAVSGTSRHRPAATAPGSRPIGGPADESHMDITVHEVGSPCIPRQRQASVLRWCRCPQVRPP